MTSRRTRAAVLEAPGTLVLREFELTELKGRGALVEVLASGICGTDVEQYRGLMSEDSRRTPIPAVPGHEPVGRIVAIDPDTASAWQVGEGDVVTARASWGCGECDACRSDTPAGCRSRGGTYGFSNVNEPPHLLGGFAEHQFLHHLSVVKRIPHTMDPLVATLVNPVACGLSWGVSAPRLQPGERVLVLGAGQRGLCTAAAARLGGASQVVLAGIAKDQFKLDRANDMGVDRTVLMDDEMSAESLADALGGPADIVVDTTPFFTGALPLGVQVAAQGARLISAGIKGRDQMVNGLDQDQVTFKELVIMGVSTPAANDFLAAVDLLEANEDVFAPLLTHAFALTDVDLAVRAAGGGVEWAHAIHVALDCRAGATSRPVN